MSAATQPSRGNCDHGMVKARASAPPWQHLQVLEAQNLLGWYCRTVQSGWSSHCTSSSSWSMGTVVGESQMHKCGGVGVHRSAHSGSGLRAKPRGQTVADFRDLIWPLARTQSTLMADALTTESCISNTFLTNLFSSSPVKPLRVL